MSPKKLPPLTEEQMREAEVPNITSPQDLLAYIDSLVDRPHDYGTCVYAMSMAATATFNYVAGKLGVTGFQASCADMDILRRTRHMEHGFSIIDWGDIFYPQYWERDNRVMHSYYYYLTHHEDYRQRFADEARKRLKGNHGGGPISERVLKHWEWLASLAPPQEDPLPPR